MRLAGLLPSQRSADRLLPYLELRLGLRVELRAVSRGVEAWVLDEDELGRAELAVQQFLADPSAERHEAAAREQRGRERLVAVEAAKRAALEEERQLRRSRRLRIKRRGLPWVSPVTHALLVLGLACGLGLAPPTLLGGGIQLFLCLTLLHDIGSSVEALRGSWMTAALIGLFACLSGSLQVGLGHEPQALLASAVHGLFGLRLVSGVLDSSRGLALGRGLHVTMALWLVACCAGLQVSALTAVQLACLAAGMLGGAWMQRGRMLRAPISES